LIIVAYISLLI